MIDFVTFVSNASGEFKRTIFSVIVASFVEIGQSIFKLADVLTAVETPYLRNRLTDRHARNLM